MKKLFSFILLSAAMMMSGSAWAADAPEPLTFTCIADGSISAINAFAGILDPDIQYFINGEWTKWNLSAIEMKAGDVVKMKGNNPHGFGGVVDASAIGQSSNLKFCTLKFNIPSGKFSVSGNIMSLINSTDSIDTIPSKAYDIDISYYQYQIKLSPTPWAFYGMFLDCNGISDASGLKLPATELAPYCYEEMFNGCTNLETAPSELPATTLKECCYKQMFQSCSTLVAAPNMAPTAVENFCCFNMFFGCSSLVTAPEKLPAETLAKNCYSSMFAHCHELTKAPELPATTLDTSCYGGMFQNCKSLEIAPELPAKELAYGCYGQMFELCTSLSSISVGFTQWRYDTSPYNWSATSGWLPNQAIDFHCPLELPISTYSTSFVPSGSTVYRILDQDDENMEAKLKTTEAQNFTIKRTMYKDGGWNTICLPVKVNSIAESCLAGCSLYAFTSASKEGDVLTLTITDVTDNDTLSAGVPYLIKWADGDDMKSMSFNGPIAATSPKCAGDGIQLKGTFAPKSIVGESSNILFVGANNTLYWPKDGNINGFRAYFEASSSAPVRRGMTAVLTEGRTTPTGMNQVTGDRLQETDVEKLIEQGKVVIMCDGVKYNLNGQIIQ